MTDGMTGRRGGMDGGREEGDDGGGSNGLDRLVGPVFRPPCSLSDPVPDQGDFFRSKRLSGRHLFIRVMMNEASVELAFFRFASNYKRIS